MLTFDPPENIGGIEGRARNYTRELNQLGHKVSLVSCAPGKKFAFKTFEGTPLMEHNSSLGELPHACASVLVMMERSGTEAVVVLSGSHTALGVFVLAYSRLRRYQSLTFFFGRDLLSARSNSLEMILGSASLRLANKIAANSEFTKNLLPSRYRSKCIVIYPSVTTQECTTDGSQEDGTGTKILFVGRLVRRKGVDLLIRAFAEVLKVSPDAKLVIVGEGPESHSLMVLGNELGLTDKVKFPGALRGKLLDTAFRQAAVLVMPSRRDALDAEGFGTVFIEAASFGIPAIGTLTGGITEAILDGETGLLVPEEDVNALSGAIIRLLTDAALRKKLGDAARRRASTKFGMEAAVQLIESSLGR